MTTTCTPGSEHQALKRQGRYCEPAKGVSQTTSDVTLLCNGQEFSFPRNLLSEASPVFQAMFGTGFEEALTGKANLDSIEPDIMESILTFIATKTIKDVNDTDVDHWCRLLESSHLLQMTDLSNFCLRQMCGKVKPEEFLTPWTLANLCDYSGFAAMIRTLAANNFDEIVQMQDFHLLTFEQLKELVMHPVLVISSMDVLVSALFRWVEFDIENRAVHLLELIDLVDLSTLSKGYVNVMICHRLVKKSHRIRSRFFAAVSGLGHSKSCLLRPKVKRNSPKLYCFGSKKDKQVLATYDLGAHQWLPLEFLPFIVTAGMAAVFCGNRIYLVGGCDSDEPTKISSKMFIYYPDTKVLSQTRLLSEVSHAGAGVLHGNVYLVNGVNVNNEPVTDVQQYDTISDVCRRLLPTHQGHVRPFVGASEDYLYVVGSCDDSQKGIERYDSFMCQWTSIASIPGSIDWCHATLCHHQMFVVPSVCDAVFQIYNIREKTWREVDFGEPCPDRVWGLWSVDSKSDDSHTLIVRDRGHVLQFFNIATETWENSSFPNENLWYGPQTVVAD